MIDYSCPTRRETISIQALGGLYGSTMATQAKPPPGWGTDYLTHYLEAAYRSRWATFARKQPAFDALAAVDDCFVKVSADWTNPQHQVPALLLIRSHAAFRGAVEHAMASQIGETYPLIRLTLECAGYALHMAKNPTLAETWLRRHDGEAEKGDVLKSFRFGAIKDTIRAVDQVAERKFAQLYELTVDFGAHPNERGLTGTLTVEEGPRERRVETAMLAGDGAALDYALTATFASGVWSLTVLGEAFPARFELLGINHALSPLRRRLRNWPS